MKILDQILTKIQTPILPKSEISIFEKLGFGKMRNRDTKTKILTFKEFGSAKSIKSAPQNQKLDDDFDFLGPKFNFENFIFESISLFPLEFRFETPKFELGDVEKPQIYFFAPKFKFFLNLPKS